MAELRRGVVPATMTDPFADDWTKPFWDAALDDLDRRIGIERIRVLHVNDSKTPLGSNRDRHDRVGEGLIGDGLATFLSHPAFADLPAITETWEDAGRDTEDLDRMRALRRRGRRRRGRKA